MADELARRLGYARPPPVRGRWVGACLRHARVAPVVRRYGLEVPEVLAVEHLPGLAVPVVVSRFVVGRAPGRGPGADLVWRSVGEQLAGLHAVPRSVLRLELRSFAQHPAVDPGRLDSSLARRVQALRDRLVGDVLPDDRQVLCHGVAGWRRGGVRSSRDPIRG